MIPAYMNWPPPCVASQPQFEEPQEQHAVAAAAVHARHSSIDMGLLNRHLHGGSSTTSSQRGRSKQQLSQPVLLYEPVTSTEHWRSSSGHPLLPPGMASSSSREGQAAPAARQDQLLQQSASAPAEPAQRAGSPASSEGGGSSFYSGELPGSPEKRPSAGDGGAGPCSTHACPASRTSQVFGMRLGRQPLRWAALHLMVDLLFPAGHNRSSSYAQRHAGTAQWVFDRANSAENGAQTYLAFGSRHLPACLGCM